MESMLAGGSTHTEAPVCYCQSRSTLPPQPPRDLEAQPALSTPTLAKPQQYCFSCLKTLLPAVYLPLAFLEAATICVLAAPFLKQTAVLASHGGILMFSRTPHSHSSKVALTYPLLPSVRFIQHFTFLAAMRAH